ncbi:MAG: hypothetical protein N2544_08835 [Burkholderiales bacterium]|nr:hypothetical protein [Burkholderiales bacterium]
MREPEDRRLSPRALADALREAVRRCDGEDARRVVNRLARAVPGLRAGAAMRAAHDALLFTIAHPPDEATQSAAEGCLARLGKRIAARAAADRTTDARLANSGLPGTLIEADFSHLLAKWLASAYPARVALAGARADPELTQLFMRLALVPGEAERLEREHYRLEGWLARIAPSMRARRLPALLAAIDSATGDERLREYLYASLAPTLRWRLAPPSPALATARGLPRPTFFQDGWARDVALGERLARPLPRPAALARAERAHLVATARVVLGSLLRETDPVTYADEDAVALYRLERGIDVALFGMRPPWRLALETYFGYLAFRNGVPAAYGGAWTLGHRCKIGINVFPHMRGGESALLFAELMRVYRGRFGPGVFFVEPYQIGRGNADGIRSGAFWFYYRLGFRPVQHELDALAAAEGARMAGERGYRTPAPTLRRLAEADLRWAVPGAGSLPTPDPYAVNRALSARIAREHAGDRAAAVAAARPRALALFAALVPRAESEAIARAFGPLLAMLGDVDRWTRPQRAALAALLTAKLSGDETRHARLVLRHRRFLDALARAAAASARAGR